MNNPDLLKLLGSMSLKEKVMQLVQLPGGVYSSDAAVTGVETDDISSDERLLAGSTLGIWGAEKLRRIQADYMDRHPHHIPLLFMLDVIHGHKTMFPCPLATGATFNPDLARDTAAAAAAEAVREKAVEDLFADFYEEQTGGDPPDEDEYDLLKFAAELIRRREAGQPLQEKEIDRLLEHAGTRGGEDR